MQHQTDASGCFITLDRPDRIYKEHHAAKGAVQRYEVERCFELDPSAGAEPWLREPLSFQVDAPHHLLQVPEPRAFGIFRRLQVDAADGGGDPDRPLASEAAGFGNELPQLRIGEIDELPHEPPAVQLMGSA
ncbi:hypothetical protein AQJ43_28815 [Streptomyces avermitilis]|nr:hypothetical protein AQJ43_28815 [Streptomyces avermitilis]OOV20963.1 hypothetical protein SM007_35430 [Streptomyces avermitilis]